MQHRNTARRVHDRATVLSVRAENRRTEAQRFSISGGGRTRGLPLLCSLRQPCPCRRRVFAKPAKGAHWWCTVFGGWPVGLVVADGAAQNEVNEVSGICRCSKGSVSAMVQHQPWANSTSVACGAQRLCGLLRPVWVVACVACLPVWSVRPPRSAAQGIQGGGHPQPGAP